MSWYYDWRPYVPVAERRAKAAREVAKLAKKRGRAASPVVLEGRKIAATFWGKAWCDNLEAYSDFANRLPRGRTYVRNGSVVDLQIEEGTVTAMVAGSELYKIKIQIKPLAPKIWKAIQAECAGKIDSLLELLQGKLSSAVMQIVTRQNGGLFPAPREIELDCSCPDWADLCKHVAASLYGVGAKLDRDPALLFLLRGVDPSDLISKASAAEAVRQTGPVNGAAALSESEVAEVFGIELDSQPAALSPAPEVNAAPAEAPATTLPSPKPAPRKTRQQKAAPSAAKPKKRQTRRLSQAARARIAAAFKARWAKLKQQGLAPVAGSRSRRKKPSKTTAAPVPSGSAPEEPGMAQP